MLPVQLLSSCASAYTLLHTQQNQGISIKTVIELRKVTCTIGLGRKTTTHCRKVMKTHPGTFLYLLFGKEFIILGHSYLSRNSQRMKKIITTLRILMKTYFSCESGKEKIPSTPRRGKMYAELRPKPAGQQEH